MEFAADGGNPGPGVRAAPGLTRVFPFAEKENSPQAQASGPRGVLMTFSPGPKNNIKKQPKAATELKASLTLVRRRVPFSELRLPDRYV